MYRRVIPRDLFNESNLLYALGRVALHAHEYGLPNDWMMQNETNEVGGFNIAQDLTNGGIFCLNVHLKHNKTYEVLHLWRPLNNKNRWCLYVTAWPSSDWEEDIPVLNAIGGNNPTSDFLEFLDNYPQG